ncbi:MAG: hypothetical protein QXK37_05005 [Candidatus Woesearchaeota archaeon]
MNSSDIKFDLEGRIEGIVVPFNTTGCCPRPLGFVYNNTVYRKRPDGFYEPFGIIKQGIAYRGSPPVAFGKVQKIKQNSGDV